MTGCEHSVFCALQAPHPTLGRGPLKWQRCDTCPRPPQGSFTAAKACCSPGGVSRGHETNPDPAPVAFPSPKQNTRPSRSHGAPTGEAAA